MITLGHNGVEGEFLRGIPMEAVADRVISDLRLDSSDDPVTELGRLAEDMRQKLMGMATAATAEPFGAWRLSLSHGYIRDAKPWGDS